jgi:hypothetical protein
VTYAAPAKSASVNPSRVPAAPPHLADELLQHAAQDGVVARDLVEHLLGCLEGRHLGRRRERGERGARLGDGGVWGAGRAGGGGGGSRSGAPRPEARSSVQGKGHDHMHRRRRP